MRGKAPQGLPHGANFRITPAYAGKSHVGDRVLLREEDHPRLCGEKILSQEASSEDIGSPPPMRGKAAATPETRSSTRITPAYAGKSL